MSGIEERQMTKIIVVGAGIGGISQVYELRKELGKQHDVVLIGDSEHFTKR